MKWFKHDSNAHTDTKLKKLRHKYGIQGYGLYWYCLELIAGKISKENITFNLEDDAETISVDWNLDQLKVQEIMQYMCDLALFDNNNGSITCLKLAKRLDDTNSKNPEIRAIISLLNNDSELVGETPNQSDQIRLDKIRLEDNIKTPGKKNLIPENFHLDNELIKYAESKKVTDINVLETFTESFINSCKAKEYKYADFNATWKNWFRDSLEKGKFKTQPQSDFQKAVILANEKNLDPFKGAPYETVDQFVERINAC